MIKNIHYNSSDVVRFLQVYCSLYVKSVSAFRKIAVRFGQKRVSVLIRNIKLRNILYQSRFPAGVREVLECGLNDKPIRSEYLFVDGGRLAGAGAHSYSAGNATGGSEEAAEFKRVE